MVVWFIVERCYWQLVNRDDEFGDGAGRRAKRQ